IFGDIDLDALRLDGPADRYDLVSVTWDPVTGDPSTSEKKAKRRDKHGISVVGYRTEEDPETKDPILKADILHTESHKAEESPSDVAERVVALWKSYR